MNNTPVILITYKRAWHTGQVLSALKEHNIKNLFIFSDGPKDNGDLSDVYETRLLFQRIDWTRPTIIEQDKNIGLANSIVSAVIRFFEKSDRIILLEDDCVPQKHFFDFISTCLDKYENNEKVFGISGYTVPVPESVLKKYPHDLYFFPRIGSWGWATWKRAWQRFEPDLAKAYKKTVENNIDLSQGGTDIPLMLNKMLGGKLKDVWTLHWGLTVYLNKGYYIYPTISHIKNIGMDGSGVHCGKTNKFLSRIAYENPSKFPDNVSIDEGIYQNFRKYYDIPKSIPKLPQRSPKTSNPLKIVHLCTNDFGGAGNAAYRLHKGLQSIGVDSTMIVLNKGSGDPSVKVLPNDYSKSMVSCLDVQVYNSPVWNQQNGRWHKLMSEYPERPAGLEIFTDAVSDVRLDRVRELQEADIINLHWVAGTVNWPNAPLGIEDKPIVWTLHDMNPFTGGCHYAGDCKKYMEGCGACPQLGSNVDDDLSHHVWEQKCKAYQDLNINVVTPSRWLGKCASESKLFSRFSVRVISYGFPLDTFRPHPKAEIHKALKIPDSVKIILFGAHSVLNERKGFAYLLAALNKIPLKNGHDIAILTFGSLPKGIKISSKYSVVNLGSIADEKQLAMVFSVADVFVLPSLEDNLPNTVIEAMACGVPVVGFDIGGMPDMIEHKKTGYLVKPKDIKGLIEGIDWVISSSDSSTNLSERCREKVEEEYALEVPAKSYYELYRGIFKDHFPNNKSLKHEYPRISIITPSYNQGEFLEESIDSILSQNYPNLEYIIMDGGSTDGSVDIIKKYQKYLTYWQCKADGGQYAAINEGFKRTSGEIMSWLNSDDIFHAQAFDAIAAIFSHRDDVAWVMGRPNLIDESGRLSQVMDGLPLWSREKYLQKKYRNPFIQQEGTFWRRSLWEAAGSYLQTDLKLAGDLELWVRFFRHARLVSVDALIAGYRKHSNQKAQLFMREYIQEAEEIIDREIKRFSGEKNSRSLPAPIPISKYELNEYTRAYISGKPGVTAKNNVQQSFKSGLNASENMVVDPPQNISVSAVVSTYNAEKFIRGCMQDLLKQTLYKKRGLEIIVVDSGSSEYEGRIIRELQNDYPKIKYIRTEHRETVYQAWNRGIKLASGKYITNANTDDRHRTDAFERMVNLLEMRPDIVLVYADLLKTETPNETFENCTAVGRFTWYDWDRSKLLNEGCFIGPQPMWRRSVHDIYGYFDEEFVTSGDYEFWLRISQTFNFHHIREPLGLYLIRPDSIEHREAKRKPAEDKKIHSMYSDAEQKGEIIRLRQNTDNEQDSSQLNTPIQLKKITGDNTMKSYEKFYQSIQPLLDGSNPENAIAALSNLANSFPDFAQAHNDLGVLYYQSGEKEKALNHYEQAAQLEPDNVTFKKNLADYYYVEQGRVEDALRIYVNLLERNPQDVEILLITGHICVSLQQIEDAGVFYNRVLEIEPWNADARKNLDQLEKMAPDFTDNQTPEEMYSRIKPLLEAEDPQPAIDALDKLLAAAPDFALAHNDLGVLCYRAGQKEKALSHYEQAVQIEPGNGIFQKNLADFYFVEQGRVEDALKIYVDVLTAYPEDIETLLITGHICVSLHKFDDAGVFYRRILEIEPWNADARQNLDKLDGIRQAALSAPQGGETGRFMADG